MQHLEAFWRLKDREMQILLQTSRCSKATMLSPSNILPNASMSQRCHIAGLVQEFNPFFNQQAIFVEVYKE